MYVGLEFGEGVLVRREYLGVFAILSLGRLSRFLVVHRISGSLELFRHV